MTSAGSRRITHISLALSPQNTRSQSQTWLWNAYRELNTASRRSHLHTSETNSLLTGTTITVVGSASLPPPAITFVRLPLRYPGKPEKPAVGLDKTSTGLSLVVFAEALEPHLLRSLGIDVAGRSLLLVLVLRFPREGLELLGLQLGLPPALSELLYFPLGLLSSSNVTAPGDFLLVLSDATVELSVRDAAELSLCSKCSVGRSKQTPACPFSAGW